jgi:hypothetical protein
MQLSLECVTVEEIANIEIVVAMGVHEERSDI